MGSCSARFAGCQNNHPQENGFLSIVGIEVIELTCFFVVCACCVFPPFIFYWFAFLFEELCAWFDLLMVFFILKGKTRARILMCMFFEVHCSEIVKCAPRLTPGKQEFQGERLQTTGKLSNEFTGKECWITSVDAWVSDSQKSPPSGNWKEKKFI